MYVCLTLSCKKQQTRIRTKKKKMLFVMMQKRQREKKIGQYIQAKCVNGFSFF